MYTNFPWNFENVENHPGNGALSCHPKDCFASSWAGSPSFTILSVDALLSQIDRIGGDLHHVNLQRCRWVQIWRENKYPKKSLCEGVLAGVSENAGWLDCVVQIKEVQVVSFGEQKVTTEEYRDVCQLSVRGNFDEISLTALAFHCQYGIANCVTSYETWNVMTCIVVHGHCIFQSNHGFLAKFYR